MGFKNFFKNIFKKILSGGEKKQKSIKSLIVNRRQKEEEEEELVMLSKETYKKAELYCKKLLEAIGLLKIVNCAGWRRFKNCEEVQKMVQKNNLDGLFKLADKFDQTTGGWTGGTRSNILDWLKKNASLDKLCNLEYETSGTKMEETDENRFIATKIITISRKIRNIIKDKSLRALIKSTGDIETLKNYAIEMSTGTRPDKLQNS